MTPMTEDQSSIEAIINGFEKKKATNQKSGSICRLLAILYQLGRNKRELDFFNIILYAVF